MTSQHTRYSQSIGGIRLSSTQADSASQSQLRTSHQGDEALESKSETLPIASSLLCRRGTELPPETPLSLAGDTLDAYLSSRPRYDDASWSDEAPEKELAADNRDCADVWDLCSEDVELPAHSRYFPNESVDTDSWSRRPTTKELLSPTAFEAAWEQIDTIGTGSDGLVMAYRHKETRALVAVKIPRFETSKSKNAIEAEIDNLEKIGEHENVISMIAATMIFPMRAPALFLPLCDLGDLQTYIERWWADRKAENKPARVAEVTMWKLFADMLSALAYLHSGAAMGTKAALVHNDLKPANILVVTPAGHDPKDGLPLKPVFKLTDFARLTPFPTPAGQNIQEWYGTPEFGPPVGERTGPLHPAVDIWALGATLQFFGLGIVPIQSKEACIADRQAQGLNCLDEEGSENWEAQWRYRRIVVFRPLNEPRDVLVEKFDVNAQCLPQDYQPFDTRLNLWYTKLMEPNYELRLSAETLRKYVLPLLELHIEVVERAEKIMGCLEASDEIREEVERRRLERKAGED